MIPIVKDFSKIAGSSFINLLLGLLTTPLITRLVSPEQYGNWSLFCIYSSVFASICLFGSDYVIVRYYYENKDKRYRSQLVRWCCFVSLMIILVSSIPIYLILYHIRPSWNWIILCLLIINTTLNVLNRLINLLLRFENKINVLSLTTILHKITFVLIALFSLYYIKDYHFELLSISSTLSTFITIILCFYFITYLFRRNDSTQQPLPKRDMFFYGFPLMISGCTFLLFQTTDKLVVNFLCSESALGIYSSAASFLALFAIMQNSFTTIWWPLVMKNYEERPNNKSLYIQTNDILCFMTTIFGVLFILLKDMIILLLGHDYRSAVSILPFIIFQPILYTLSETTVIGLNFKKKSKALLYITISSLIFNVIVNVILTKSYGIKGTSIAVGLSYIFFLILRTIVSYHYYKIKFHFSKMFICVCVLFTFALIHSFYPDSVISYWISLIIFLIVLIMYKGVSVLIYKYFKEWIIKKKNYFTK